MPIFAAVHALKKEVSVIQQEYPFLAAAPKLMGVSKGQPAPMIEEAIQAGLLLYGENRVQEAKEKWPALRRKYPKVELHLIGPLQTNKVKEALALFDVIQTIDRPKLALAIAKELENWRIEELKKKDNSSVPQFLNSSIPHFYIQVNTGKEPQKAGVIPEEADDLIYLCRQLQLPVAGLMCVPPTGQPPAPHFALLREIAKRHNLPELSMGMSGDYKTAIRMGSTCVRVGTAIFGEREMRKWGNGEMEN